MPGRTGAMNLRVARPLRRWQRIALVLLAVALLVVIAGAIVLSQPVFGARMEGERLARARANPNYRDGAFVNPLPPAGYHAADVWNLFTGQVIGHEVRQPAAPGPLLPAA